MEIKIKKIASSHKDQLHQFSLWLQNLEETQNKGADVYNMLLGFLFAYYPSEDLPGPDHKNFANLIASLQNELNIDLCLCTNLKNDNGLWSCSISGNRIVNLIQCMPPMRVDCSYRRSFNEK